MHLTRRAIYLLFISAPLIAVSGWLPLLGFVAGGYLLVCIGLFALDVRFGRTRQQIDVSRASPQKLNLGAENQISLHVFNQSRWPVVCWLRDEPPSDFVVDVKIYHATVQPRHEWQVSYSVTPPVRGNYQFGNITLRWQTPLGLLVLQRTFPAKTQVKVYPNLLNVQRYELLLRRNQLREFGLRQVRQRGAGTEYERLREYLPDDDFRRIDWKATARRNRPITVEYETERSQNIFLAIETGRMMLSPVEHMAKLDYVINAGLLLTYVATRKGDKVGLMTFADQIGTFLSPGQGKGQFYKALELLYAVRPEPVEPDYDFALNYLARKQRRRSLIILFTDISSGPGMEILAAHAALLQRSNLVLVVTISDPDVLAVSSLRPSSSQDVYRRAAASQFLDERRLTLDQLRKKGIHVLDVPANKLTSEVINRYLDLKAQTLL